VKIPIHNDLFPVLRAEYERQTKVLGSRPKDASPVLLNPETGDPYSRSGLNRALEGWSRRTEIDEVRPHRFRCTFAVHCLLKGLDVRRVATLLGEKVQTVVDHYLPMSEALAQQAADILNRPVPAVRRALVPVETGSGPSQRGVTD
jgi:site-specific recombinase XerD